MKEIKTENVEKITSLRAPKGRSNLFLGLHRRKEATQHPPRNDGWRAIIYALVISLSFTGTSYARATVESLPQIEKLFLQGRYDRVISESSRLIDAGAYGREELFYLKGLSQMQLSRFREARQTFEYMVERYPKGKRAYDGYIGIGDAFFLEGKCAESISSYNDALSNFPGHKNASIVYYKIGSAYHKLGSEEKAKEYYDKAKDAAPLSFESRMIPQDLGPSHAAIVDDVKPLSKTGTSEAPDIGGYFYVQAGYFKSRNNAEGLTEKLKRKGYDSYIYTEINPVRNSEISNGVKNGPAFYKVKVGRFNTRPEAEAKARKLKSDGFKTRICR